MVRASTVQPPLRISTAPAAARSGSRARRSCRPYAPAERHLDLDVADPRRPRLLSQIELPPGWHSHKVRVAGDVMLVNHEQLGPDGTPHSAGASASTMSPTLPSPARSPSGAPRARACTATISTAATPISRRRPRAMSATSCMILDLKNPAQPEEVGRWWIPGQWKAGRRALSLGRLDAAALPSPVAPGRPALCQLLASRLLHPRHRRHVEAEAGLGAEHHAGLSASDPYLPAAAANR